MQITLEQLLKEVNLALEYGKSLGYSECLNQTIIKKPESSNNKVASEFYLKELEKKYSQ
jgi:hypothetical protein